MFTRSLSTPLRIWWKPCKRFTFTTLSRVHFSNSLYGWYGLYDIYNHLQQKNFRVLKCRKYASIPWKKWLWFVIRLSHGISRHCSEQKFMSCEQLKSFLLSCHYVLWYVLPWKLVSQWIIIIQGETTRKQPMTISHLLFKLTFKHIFIGTVLFSYIFAELRGTKKREFCPGWYEC